MVSLKHRQDLADLSDADPDLKRFEFLLNGASISASDSSANGVRDELLLAISTDDSGRFKDIATKVGKRKISPESDWCNDDYLLFLLIFGNQKFGRPLTFLSAVIDARRQNPNPIPHKINEVFGALERGEFGIDGDFGFLKIPFLHLLSKLKLGPADARKALEAMSKPRLLDQMSPFLRLLTQRAYDLVLTERQPIATETTSQLIEALESHAKDFSLGQWRRVIVALPGRLIIALVTAVVGLGLVPVLFGVGKGIVDLRRSKKQPTELAVAAIREPSSDLPPEILMLVKTTMQQSHSATNKMLAVEIESSPLATATPSFTVEASHPDKSIKSALAFTEDKTDGPRPVTVLPLEYYQGRVRAIVPEQGPGRKVCIILQFDAGSKDTFQTIGNRVILRPLQ